MNQASEPKAIINHEAAMDVVHVQWAPVWLRGLAAFVVGCIMIQAGFLGLGVHLDWFTGIATFSGSWILSMTLLPVAAGIVIGMIYGYGAKYLAHFPPLAVLLFGYYQSIHSTLPAGVELLPWGLWVMFMILQMEFCAVGGFIGEIIVRRRTGWLHRYGPAPDAVALPDDDRDQADSLRK